MINQRQDELASVLRAHGFEEATCQVSGSSREFVPSDNSLGIGCIEVTGAGIAFFLPPGISDREQAVFVVNYADGLVNELKRLASPAA